MMMSNEQQDKNFCSSIKNNATDKDQPHPQQACWQTVYLLWGGEIYLTIFKPLGTKQGLFRMLNINVLPWVLKGTLEGSNVINCKQFLDHRSNVASQPLPSPCSPTHQGQIWGQSIGCGGTYSTFLGCCEVLRISHFGPLSVARFCKTEKKRVDLCSIPLSSYGVHREQEKDPEHTKQGKIDNYLFFQARELLGQGWSYFGGNWGNQSISVLTVHIFWLNKFPSRNLSLRTGAWGHLTFSVLLFMTILLGHTSMAFSRQIVRVTIN